jgi:hypothetical protein
MRTESCVDTGVVVVVVVVVVLHTSFDAARSPARPSVQMAAACCPA